MVYPKERRFKTGDNRYGKGAVHRYVYSRESKVWYVGCRSPFKDPFGTEVEATTPITCKKCLLA